MTARHVKICPTLAERDLPFVVARHRGKPTENLTQDSLVQPRDTWSRRSA